MIVAIQSDQASSGLVGGGGGASEAKPERLSRQGGGPGRSPEKPNRARRARVRGRDKVRGDFALLAAATNLARLAVLAVI